MVIQLNRYDASILNVRHGEYLVGLNDEYIRDVARREGFDNLSDERCEEVADYIESNMFDIIGDTIREFSYQWEAEDEEEENDE